MLEKGLVQVYTSKSDQMNFAPVGLSLRAVGQGLRVYMVCFTPHELMEGARLTSELLNPDLTLEHLALQLDKNNEKKVAPEFIIEAFERARDAVFNGRFDIVIMNGINEMVTRGMISRDEILRVMKEKPENIELILSGPGADEEVIEMADLVTEMVVHKSEYMFPIGTCPDDRGAIEVITGAGKGKTTYCLGKGMLTSGIGIPALIYQFVKSPKQYGEVKAIQRLPNLDIKTMGRGFLIDHSPYLFEKHRKAAQQAWHLWLKHIFSRDYGLLVMDEINIATYHGLISADRVIEMLLLKAHKFHLILSGRNAHPEVQRVALSVIEMKEVKHPYMKGIKARKGIEF